MDDKKTKIIKLWQETKTVVEHPTYEEIAAKVGVNKSYVWRVIKDYQASLGVASQR